jgi:MFS family permease
MPDPSRPDPAARATAARHKAELLRSLRISILEGIVAMPIVTMSLPVNVFMTALVAKAFVLSKAMIGLISALPFVGNFLQLAVAATLARRRPAKSVTVAFAALHLLTWIAFGFMLSWLPRDDPDRAGWIIFWWFLVSSFMSAVGGVSWNAWMQELVPGRLRGKYFGKRNAILQVAVLAFMLAAGWTLARWEYAIPAFQAVVFGSCLLRILSIYGLWVSPTRARREAVAPRLPLAEQFRVLREAKSLHAFILFGAIWACAANAFGPFYHVFMFEQLRYSAFEVSVFTTLSQLGGALSMPAWGQLLDRHGNRSVMTVSLVLWQLNNLAWCFVTPDNRAWLYPIWTIAGVTSAGFVLGQFTLLLRVIPLEARNLAMGLYQAVVSLVAGLAPTAGGWLLGRQLLGGGDALAIYHWSFLVQPVLALLGCFLLLRVHERQASSLTMVIGAMRNIRTLGGVLGLGFLVNYVFFKPASRARPPR